MTEQELRALVRQAIARHTGAHAAPAGPTASVAPARFPDAAVARAHTSHLLLTLPATMETDGPCIIEPAVSCNHCGYCKSLGH